MEYFQERIFYMKKLIVLLMVFTLFLSSCQSADTDTTGSSSSKPEITKKQYLTHKETEVFDWKCDIPPAKIKIYDGSPIEGFFITLEDELYEYNAEEIFPQTEKNYRKVNTDFKILYIDYHFQINRLSVVADDYKTYIYDKENDTFVYTNPEFTSVVQKFAKSGEIINGILSQTGSTVFWYVDEFWNMYEIKQTNGTEYMKNLRCKPPKKTNALYWDTAIIKTESEYYCYDRKKNNYVLSEEATAAYDNIAFLNDIIVMYKDDPEHIYDHSLIYTAKFVYN